jgi:hypothetical protein
MSQPVENAGYCFGMSCRLPAGVLRSNRERHDQENGLNRFVVSLLIAPVLIGSV